MNELGRTEQQEVGREQTESAKSPAETKTMIASVKFAEPISHCKNEPVKEEQELPRIEGLTNGQVEAF